MSKVLHLTERRFPPEIRVMKESQSLSKNNFDVAVLCPSFENDEAYEIVNNIKIFRFNESRRGLIYSLFNRLTWRIFIFDINWYFALKRVIREFGPNVLHVHDIWLFRTIKLALGIIPKDVKIIVDLHENMPAAVKVYNESVPKTFKYIIAKLFINAHRIKKYELKVLRSTDLIMVVVEEAAKRINTKLIEKVIVVENLENKDFALCKTNIQNITFNMKRFTVVYIGGFGAHRGIDTMIKSAQYIQKWRLPISMHIIGATNNNPYCKYLENMVKTHKLKPIVKIHSWIPAKDVATVIRNSTICIVPHHSNDHTNTTIPHKLYQYMVLSKPVIVSTSVPLMRVVNISGAGLVFSAGDPFDLAKKIKFMYDIEPERRQNYGLNGYNYVISKGNNWEDCSEPSLINAYNSLVK